MYFALENDKLNLPDPCRLLLTESDESDPHNNSVSFVFVAVDAFQLTSYCIKPYGRQNMTDAQQILDYRSSRKLRVTENTSENSVNIFRVFSVQNNLNRNNVSFVVLASLSLHKLLCETSRDTHMPPGFTDETQIDGNICNGTRLDEASSEFLCILETTEQNQCRKDVEEIFTTFKDYFCGPGEVFWQWKVLI